MSTTPPAPGGYPHLLSPITIALRCIGAAGSTHGGGPRGRAGAGVGSGLVGRSVKARSVLVGLASGPADGVQPAASSSAHIAAVVADHLGMRPR